MFSDPLVIAAIITVGGMVVNLIATKVCDFIHDKHEFEKKRFDIAYNRRLALYEDVMIMLSKMITREELPLNISDRELTNKIFVYVHALNAFSVRLSIFGSPVSVDILFSLSREIAEIPSSDDGELEPGSGPYSAHLRAEFFNAVTNGLKKFAESVREDAGVLLVEKFIQVPKKNRVDRRNKEYKKKGGTKNNNKKKKY